MGGGVAGAALPVTDLDATNMFHTSAALGFAVATMGEATAGRN
jgi:hypothetical protein